MHFMLTDSVVTIAVISHAVYQTQIFVQSDHEILIIIATLKLEKYACEEGGLRSKHQNVQLSLTIGFEEVNLAVEVWLLVMIQRI